MRDTSTDPEVVTVHRADPDDAARLARVLAVAFHHDLVSCWVFPDEDDRAARHPGFFRAFLDHVFANGRVYTTGDLDAVALWLDVHPDTHPPTGLLDEALAAACGPNRGRFATLDALMHGQHPTGRAHAYLLFVGVLPERQGNGVGEALLGRRLAGLDITGTPAYLEASSARSRGLYQRLGFRAMPARMDLDGGTCLYPMWRPPHPAPATGPT